MLLKCICPSLAGFFQLSLRILEVHKYPFIIELFTLCMGIINGFLVDFTTLWNILPPYKIKVRSAVYLL